MEQRIGTCSLCGGAVMQFMGAWHGIYPPVATCSSCGAVKDDSGPVIPMTRPRVAVEPKGYHIACNDPNCPTCREYLYK